MNRDLKRILVFRIGHLGDTIVALPAFHAIRDAYPDAHIALLSNSSAENTNYVAAKSVLPESGLFDDWIVYSHGSNAVGAAKAFAGLLRKLRAEKFDAVFYLMTRNRTPSRINRDRMFFRTAGIKHVLGDKYLLDHLIDPSMPKPLPELKRESEFFLDMISSEGIKPSEHGSDMLSTPDELERAERWLSENCGGSAANPVVIIAPGSKWNSKVWNEEKFISVTRRLVDEHSVFPVIFGGPEDRAKGDRILAAVGTGSNAAGELNVRDGAAAMKKAVLYLGNDTGTMHMAAAAGVPCVAVFAAIDFPGRWYPFGDGHRIFRVPVECEGCHTPDCFNQHLCLESVNTEEVFSACVDILLEAV